MIAPAPHHSTSLRARLVAVGVGALCCLALVAGVPAASARVVVDKSIAGVKLGDSRKAVKRRLGKPTSHAKCGSDPISRATCGGPGVEMWTYLKRRLGVNFIHGRVAELNSTSKKERTRSGIGVGVPFAKVLQQFPGGETGGGSTFQWYFLGRAPAATGDVFTLVDSATGKLTGRIRDLQIGRFDERYHCMFFACA